MKTFNRKMALGILLLLLLLVPMLAGATFSLYEVISAQNDLITNYTQELLTVKDLQRRISSIGISMRGYVLTGNPEELRIFEVASQETFATLLKLKQLAKDPETKRKLDIIEKLQRETYNLAPDGIIMKRKGRPISEVNEYFQETTVPQTKTVATLLEDIIVQTTLAYEKATLQVNRTSKRIVRTLTLASALVLFFSMIVGALLMKLIHQRRKFDETNEKLLKREKELSAARKETVEVVAHDLKNPLTSIIMSVQLGLRANAISETRDDKSKNRMELILRSAESMNRLIENLLDHTKIESGSLILDKKMSRLDRLIKTLAMRFELLASDKGLTLKLGLPKSLPEFSMDEIRMEQVLSNLLGNAIKFTPRGGTIQVDAFYKDDGFIISVKDSGSGMSEEQCGHIFKRYWQARATANKGAGLGLAISKAIVEAHGGQISVTSQIGQGSTFFVWLPSDSLPQMQTATAGIAINFPAEMSH